MNIKNYWFFLSVNFFIIDEIIKDFYRKLILRIPHSHIKQKFSLFILGLNFKNVFFLYISFAFRFSQHFYELRHK